MGEIKDEINWENFLDNYFDLYRPLVEKQDYQTGSTINYSKNDIYVWCDLDKDKTKIRKLEFGRYLIDNSGGQESNWIKGVFINDEHSYTTFLQTSFLGETGPDYEADFYKDGKSVVLPFLKIPCETGWTEEEYYIDADNYYKVIIRLFNRKWTITILHFAEQDIPMMFDKLARWISVKYYDSFWNISKRKVNKIQVTPMSGQFSG